MAEGAAGSPGESPPPPQLPREDLIYDQIASKVYRRVGTVLSGIGIAGLVLLGTLGKQTITSETDKTQIALMDKLDECFKELK